MDCWNLVKLTQKSPLLLHKPMTEFSPKTSASHFSPRNRSFPYFSAFERVRVSFADSSSTAILISSAGLKTSGFITVPITILSILFRVYFQVPEFLPKCDDAIWASKFLAPHWGTLRSWEVMEWVCHWWHSTIEIRANYLLVEWARYFPLRMCNWRRGRSWCRLILRLFLETFLTIGKIIYLFQPDGSTQFLSNQSCWMSNL